MACEKRQRGLCWVACACFFLMGYTYCALNSYHWNIQLLHPIHYAENTSPAKSYYENNGDFDRRKDMYLLAAASTDAKNTTGFPVSTALLPSTNTTENGDTKHNVIKEGKKKHKKKLYLMTEDEYRKAKNMNRERLLHIKKSCEKFDITTTSGYLGMIVKSIGNYYKSRGKKRISQVPQSSSFQVDSENEMLFCWQYKVGSTAWNAMFAHLLNQTRVIRDGTYYDMREIMAPRNNAQMRKALDFYRFMIVRHPFERLLSAYRDRIEDTSHRSWQRESIGPKILAITQPQLTETDMKMNGKLKVIPTFIEFVTYLLHTSIDNYDPHWVPYWKHCVPCAMNYHAVGRSETHEQDIRFILEDSGLAQKVDIKILEENAHQGRGDTRALMFKYYSTLKPGTLEKLYHRYEVDFFLFDYDVQPLLNELYPSKNVTFSSSFP